MSDPLSPPKNHALLENKLSLLSTLKFERKNSISFSFHDIAINFHTTDENLLAELDTYLPVSWKKKASKGLNIFHHPIPESFKDHFEDESSSLVHNFYEDNSFIGIQRDFVAKSDPQGNCICIFDGSIDDGLHNFFRWYLSPKLIPIQKAMIHSSVVLGDKKKGIVFLGPSGAGKTTVTTLSKPRTILSDDMNLLQIEDGKLYVLPGGVGGLYKPDVDFDQKFEVDKILWLVQDSKGDKLENLSPIVQHRHLLSSFANLPWGNVSSQEGKEILELCNQILALKPLESLHFRKSADFWELLE